MLVLPIRSPSSSPSRQRDPSPFSIRISREEAPQSLELRKQVASNMLSVVPQQPPGRAHKRPKLSLQTSVFASNLIPSTSCQIGTNLNTQSPTTSNTQQNSRLNDGPSSTSSSSSSTTKSDVEILPSSSTTTNSSTSLTSSTNSQTSFLLSPKIPYSLPLGHRSILRNGPLPRHIRSAITTRMPLKHLFAPVKRVTFTRSSPENILPSSSDETVYTISASETKEEDSININNEDNDIEMVIADPSTETPEATRRREERKAAIQEEDGGHTSRNSRRSRPKRRREWIWRPTDDDNADDAREYDVENKGERNISSITLSVAVERPPPLYVDAVSHTD